MLEAVAKSDGSEEFGGFAAEFGSKPAREEGDEDVLNRGKVTDQVERLENEADLVTPVEILLGVRHRRQLNTVDLNLARRGVVERTEQIKQGTLPRPAGPDDEREPAGGDRASDPSEGVDHPLAALERLLDVFDFDHRPGRFHSARHFNVPICLVGTHPNRVHRNHSGRAPSGVESTQNARHHGKTRPQQKVLGSHE